MPPLEWPVLPAVPVVQTTAALEQDLSPAPPDYVALIAGLRQMPARDLILMVWGDGPQGQAMLRIAARESGLGRGHTDAQSCAADNPRSSAAGLFQTLSLHRKLAESKGLSWANIVGPDCLDDVLLAKALWDGDRARGGSGRAAWGE